MRPLSKFTIAPLLALGVAMGCRDGVVSPSSEPFSAPALVAPASISLAPAGRPSLDVTGGKGDSASVDFSVGPNGGVFLVGNNLVVFPAQSICDPATSSYGPATWDQPCTPLASTLKVHAEARNADGRSWVDFTPSLRFVPSSYPSRWVWLAMYAPGAVGSSDLSKFNILWTQSIGGAMVDETPTDPTLRTYVDTFSGISIRRIKHFSGFTSQSGRDCDSGGEGCGESPTPP
jgi:hypothetical protein